ncbi:hypothetical protein C479_14528 [Halovivax asiaticus JCM 14624]|uniref:SHOCT domain-containing protein n=1 Tax=Halovivax asiaticus JCM 14624 TaxID=1227490 RepID=M0BE48_9EURY|nr:SHOCT domain-containing protein [Halovivax asiaticus]ELZ08563.1 hypothetical protein C479_14528 [Halovivax asiaticus JCM 14624]
MSDDTATRLRENATGIASLLVTGCWLALMFSGVGNTLWLVTLLVGYIVVVPLVSLLYGDEEDAETWWDANETEQAERDESTETARRGEAGAGDALETLRERYAAGELTDEQFEGKLERLLATETLEDAAERGGSVEAEPAHDRDVEFERERDGV